MCVAPTQTCTTATQYALWTSPRNDAVVGLCHCERFCKKCVAIHNVAYFGFHNGILNAIPQEACYGLGV
ncbi:hypothetical protein [Helicobacter sp.]|uniref:hypothetical protein n=1 Tax=Helicobacter sp. TaxID=218 RepID=UPI0025C54BB7|nr:hypothetical protein [Helicobacter sp.]MCI5633017.1 hypothetical protein [Helicobacter sp.]MDY5557507.1 hypothetical protein [Helicobacter sp.]